MAKKTKEDCCATRIHQSGCERIAGAFKGKNTGCKNCKTDQANRGLSSTKSTEAGYQIRTRALKGNQHGSCCQ